MDINRGIRTLLEEKFTDIPVQIKDIKNPKPPCFYIKAIADSSTQTAQLMETTNYSFSVIYFSKSETLEDLLSVKEELKRIFRQPLRVISYDNKDFFRYVEINSIESTLDEDSYILNVILNIEHTQEIADRFESDNTHTMDIMELE